ncbi:MAG: SRPBCC domain-containing protein [Pseudomonadota bacterium]
MDARTKNDATSTADREMVITRIVDAPRELVWEAMTNPKHVVNWWGPNGFTNTLEKMDFRVGGVWKHVMHGPDGKDYPNFSTFTAIVKPERIEFSHGGTSKGDPAVQFEATWTFEALSNQTRVTIRAVFPTVEARDITVKVYNAIEGGQQTLARLAEYLPTISAGKDAMSAGKSDLVITRIFDAPRELVWKAWTEPGQLMRWWAPKGCTTPFCKEDLRIGGKFHYCMRLPEGRDIWGMGIYREIVAPALIVYTDSFADAQGNPVPPAHYGMSASHPAETLVTVSFEEHEGKTRLTLRHAIPVSVEEREGTEQGWGEMLDRLAEILR